MSTGSWILQHHRNNKEPDLDQSSAGATRGFTLPEDPMDAKSAEAQHMSTLSYIKDRTVRRMHILRQLGHLSIQALKIRDFSPPPSHEGLGFMGVFLC